MLRSCDDDLFTVAIPDAEKPGPAPLTDNGPGLAMEPAVGHPFLGAGFADDVHLLAELESLDERGYGKNPAFSLVFFEFIPGLFSGSVMVCHKSIT
jgi:hypothetical protein